MFFQNIVMKKSISTVFFITVKYYYGHNNQGDLLYDTGEFYVPCQMVYPVPLWPYRNKIFQQKIKEDEWIPNSKVLILKHQNYQGYFGKIKETSHENKDNLKVFVKKSFSKPMNFFTKKKEKENNYIPLIEIGKMLKTDIFTILTVLDSLKIIMDSKSPLFNEFGGQIDIGLNLISQDFFQIVPEMVICKKLEEGSAPKRWYFEYLAFSEEAVKILKEYHQNFPKIFHVINDNRKKIYQSVDFFKENSNLEIVKIYGWLLRQNTSTLAQVPINSKVFFKKKIKKIMF